MSDIILASMGSINTVVLITLYRKWISCLPGCSTCFLLWESWSCGLYWKPPAWGQCDHCRGSEPSRWRFLWPCDCSNPQHCTGKGPIVTMYMHVLSCLIICFWYWRESGWNEHFIFMFRCSGDWIRSWLSENTFHLSIGYSVTQSIWESWMSFMTKTTPSLFLFEHRSGQLFFVTAIHYHCVACWLVCS